jgi:Protein of unknown function (DUF3761)
MDKKRVVRDLALVASLLVAQVAIAQAPAGAPAGATGLCKDGSYYSGANKKGACRGHKGVKEWYRAPTTNSKAAAATDETSVPSTTSKSARGSTATPTSSTPATKSETGTAAAAPGGGPDQVWLNTASNVYHCPGTRYYGKTKVGAYMTEAEAKAKGGRPDHGKACK